MIDYTTVSTLEANLHTPPTSPRPMDIHSLRVEMFVAPEQLIQVKAYFANNPNKTKYSKKTNNLNVSFIKVNNQIYLIPPNSLIGQGKFGRVKKVINIDSNQVFAMKISATNSETLRQWKEEQNVLDKLGQCLGFIEDRKENRHDISITNEEPSSKKRINKPIKFSLSQAINSNTQLFFEKENVPVNNAISTELSLDKAKTTYLSLAKNNKQYWVKKSKDPEKIPSQYTTKIGYIMPLHKGVSLKKYLENNKELNTAKKLQLLLAIFNAIEEIHKIAIHNDLHPDNILVEEINQQFFIYIIDFGLCRKLAPLQLVVPAHDLENYDCSLISGRAPEQIQTYSIFADHVTCELAEHHKQHPLYQAIDNIHTIYTKNKCGFSSPYSDLYSLGSGLISSSFVDQSDPFLVELIHNMKSPNPFDRLSLLELKQKCLARLKELQHPKYTKNKL